MALVISLWDKLGLLGQVSLIAFALLIVIILWFDHVIKWVERLDLGEDQIFDDRHEPTLDDFKDLIDAVNEERSIK